MEKAKLVKWLLINNISIDEYLYLLFFLAKNLARNKKSRCLNHKTYVLFHLLECILVAYEKWSFFMCYNIYGFRLIYILMLIYGSSVIHGFFYFPKKLLTRIYVYIILYMYLITSTKEKKRNETN